VLVPLASLWIALALHAMVVAPEVQRPVAAEQPDTAEQPDAAEQPAEPDLDEAKRLFDEGTARYDAADFDGAIETFTLALSELRTQGVLDFRIRGLLLFNIGRTHMRAYGIDDEVEHLRQAKSIFHSFIDEAQEHADEVDAGDIEEAKAKLVEIDALLAALDEPAPAQAKPKRERKPKRDRPEPKGDPKQLRAMGAGLTAGGVVLLGGGIGMMAWGAGFGAAAERQVAGLNDLGLSADDPAFADGDSFIAAERRKGATWLGVGGVAIAAGVGVVSFGVRQLITAKRVEQHRASNRTAWAPTAGFGREGAWLGVAGRF
jgi:tetratricopeptide (TPR) repeat protein